MGLSNAKKYMEVWPVVTYKKTLYILLSTTIAQAKGIVSFAEAVVFTMELCEINYTSWCFFFNRVLFYLNILVTNHLSCGISE